MNRPHLALVQNGRHPPGICYYLTLLQLPHQIYQTDQLDSIQPDSHWGVILLGGSDSVTDMQEDLLQQFASLITRFVTASQPVIGICLGCQILGNYIGGKVESLPNTLTGYDTTVLGIENVLRCHRDYLRLDDVDDNLTVWNTQDGIPYSFQYGECIYGLQCHPDVLPCDLHLFSTDMVLVHQARLQEGEIHQRNLNLLHSLFTISGIPHGPYK